LTYDRPQAQILLSRFRGEIGPHTLDTHPPPGLSRPPPSDTARRQGAAGSGHRPPSCTRGRSLSLTGTDSPELTVPSLVRAYMISSRKYSIIQNAGLSPAGQASLCSTVQAAGTSALSSTFEERSPRGAAILTRSLEPSDAYLYAESLRASKRQALLPAALAVEEDATARMDLLLGVGQPPARQAESSSMPRAASRDPAPASVGGGLAPAQGLDSRSTPIPSSAHSTRIKFDHGRSEESKKGYHCS
jgi:hypothetical protein